MKPFNWFTDEPEIQDPDAVAPPPAERANQGGFQPWLYDTGLPQTIDGISTADQDQNVPMPTANERAAMNPDVKRYLMDKYWERSSSEGVKEAKAKRDILNGIGVGIQGVSLATQGDQRPQVFRSGFNRSGPPQMTRVTGSDVDTSALNQAGDRAVGDAMEARQSLMARDAGENQVRSAANREINDAEDRGFKRDENAASAKANDPSSPISQRAGMLLANTLNSKAKEAEAAGDAEAAAKIRSQAREATGMSATESMALLKNMQGLDYKDVLWADASKSKERYQTEAAMKLAAAREKDKADKAAQGLLKKGTDMRERLQRNPAYQSMQKTDTYFQQMDELQNMDSNAADQALIILFNKMIEPTSVVMNSEFVRTREGQDLATRAEQLWGQYREGRILTPDMKKEMMATMTAMRRANQRALTQILEPYEYEIDQQGIDRGQVFPGGGISRSGQEQSPSPQPTTRRPATRAADLP